MPLNDDPDALSDSEYAALIEEMKSRAVAEVCPVAVPRDVLAAALSRLDEREDYSG